MHPSATRGRDVEPPVSTREGDLATSPRASAVFGPQVILETLLFGVKIRLISGVKLTMILLASRPVGGWSRWRCGKAPTIQTSRDFARLHQAACLVAAGGSGVCLPRARRQGRAETDNFTGIVVGAVLRCAYRSLRRVLTRTKAVLGDGRRQEEGLTWMRRAKCASIGTKSSRVAPIAGNCLGKAPVYRGARSSRSEEEAQGRRQECAE